MVVGIDIGNMTGAIGKTYFWFLFERVCYFACYFSLYNNCELFRCN